MLRKIGQSLLLRQNPSRFRALCTSRENESTARIRKEIEEFKEKAQWRVPVGQGKGEWQSHLRAFGDTEQNSDLITLLQQPIDLSPSGLKKWWVRRKERIERFMQQYIPERHAILGSDLAAAHFIVYRGGAVKFLHNPEWVRKDEQGEYELPDRFHGGFKVEAIRCDNMTLYYEGLENIRRLQHLKFWSFINVKTFDDWCLDRVSSAENPCLEVLDLTGTNITHNGLSALYRVDSLKVLVLDNPQESKEMELTCALLELCLPHLKIRASKEIHGE